MISFKRVEEIEGNARLALKNNPVFIRDGVAWIEVPAKLCMIDIPELRAALKEAMEALYSASEWVAEGSYSTDGVPRHDCDFNTNPETGKCDFHEFWGNLVKLLRQWGEE